MADLVREDPRAYVRPGTPAFARSLFRIDRQSFRDGGSSTDRTVINTDGAPARPAAEITSYVNVCRSILPNHPHARPQTAPRSKRPYHRSSANGDADQVQRWRRLPRASLPSDCWCRRRGKCSWTLSIFPSLHARLQRASRFSGASLPCES